MTPQELKNSILKKAFTGKLVEYSSSRLEVKVIDTEENPFEIPNHWGWQIFGNICDMYTGNSIPVHVKKQKYEGLKEGYDYIGTKDVGFDQLINYNNGVRIPFETDFKIAKSGSILMCIEGGSAGRKLGVLDRDVCFGNKLCYFNSQVVLNKYIFYYLQSPLFIKEFSSNMTGIIGGVSISKLKNIYIPMPPSEEQKRIVEKIEDLMPLVDEYEKNWQKLEDLNKKFPEDMKKSLLQEAIRGKLVEQRPEEGSGEELYKLIQEEKEKLIKEGKIKKQKALPEITEDEIPFDIPKSWKWVRLGEVVSILGDGLHGTPMYDANGEYYFVNGNNLIDGKIVVTDATKKVNKEEWAKYMKPLNSSSVLISINGTIGNLSFYNYEKVILGKSACYFNLIFSSIKYYIYYLLRSDYFLKYANKEATGTTIKNVSLRTMRELLIPLPPLGEQKRIVEKLEELLPLCDQLLEK